MTVVIIAPRVEDALSDVERIVSAGWFRLRPSRTYVANGQWVQNSWSDPVPFDGTAKEAKLDPLPDNPYELWAEYPDGFGDVVTIREFRTVLDASGAVRWQDLNKSGGPGSTIPVPTNVEARLTALETALGNVSGGASNVGAISDMSALMRQVNKRGTADLVRLEIDAAKTQHTHTVDQITAAGGTGSGTKFLRDDGTWAEPSGVVAGQVAWKDVTSKPTTFPPSNHGHSIGDVSQLADRLSALDSSVAAAQSTADAAQAAASSGSTSINAAVQQALDNKADDSDLNNTPFFLFWNGTSWPAAPATSRPIVWWGGSQSTPPPSMKSTDVWLV